jgi:HK97 gp10 family phage protein
MTGVKINRDAEGWFLAKIGAQVKKVTRMVAADCIANCPVDSGDLVSTIKVRFPGQLRGVVSVGGRGPLVESAPYWKYVEWGTAPHWIDSTGPWSLRSDEGVYFGRRVWHPGTTATHFMSNAIYKRRKLERSAVR